MYTPISLCLLDHSYCLTIFYFSCMATKPINIRWIRTGSQPYWKTMYSLVLQTIFHAYQNKNLKINASFVSPKGPKTLLKKTSIDFMIFILICVKNCL